MSRTIKFIDAMRNVDKSKANEDNGYAYHIGEHYELYRIDDAKFNTRVKCYWLYLRQCTDTWVGIRVMFMDGELIGSIEQTARKNSVDLFFLSEDFENNLRKFTRECSLEDHKTCNVISDDELNEEIPVYVQYDTPNYLIYGKHKKCFYMGGKEAEFLKNDRPLDIMSNDVWIRFNGKDQKVNVKDLLFPLHITGMY